MLLKHHVIIKYIQSKLHVMAVQGKYTRNFRLSNRLFEKYVAYIFYFSRSISNVKITYYSVVNYYYLNIS